jgi:hypothetical protein
MHDQIVRKIYNRDLTADDSFNNIVNHCVEPCLLPQQSQLLPLFPVMEWNNTFSQFLVKRVRRNPRDLRAHVQRVLLYISKSDTDAVYAALIDLFLILGKNGSHIRKNLLNKAMLLLHEEQYKFLSARMESGLDSNEPLPPNTFSSLSKGHSGTTFIVKRKSTESDQSGRDPLQQAAVLIRQNDSLSAIIILEQALHHDPGNEFICRELLFLYRRQHAREPFFRTYTGLLGRCLAVPELWHETERYFLDSTCE